MSTIAEKIKREFDYYERCADDYIYHFDYFLHLCYEKSINHVKNDTIVVNCIKDDITDYRWYLFDFEDGSSVQLSHGIEYSTGLAQPFEHCNVVYKEHVRVE